MNVHFCLPSRLRAHTLWQKFSHAVSDPGSFRVCVSQDQMVAAFNLLDIDGLIHFSDVDYDLITEQGKLAAPSGGLTFAHFEEIMRIQVLTC